MIKHKDIIKSSNKTMLVLFLTIDFVPVALAISCHHGGVEVNSTFCNCTGTCFGGATCDEHIHCGSAPVIDNSLQTWNISYHTCSASVTYTCNHGYMVPDNGSGRIITTSSTCNNTVWYPTPKDCVRVTCPPPIYGAHSRQKASGYHPVYYPGDTVAFDCEKFHTDSGGYIKISCLEDGTWSGTPLLCTVHITPGMVIGLSVAACCVVLLVLLPYDFFSYRKRQAALKQRKRHHRVGVAHASASNEGTPFITPKVMRAAAYRPSSLMSQQQKELLYEQLMAEAVTGSYVSECELSEMSFSHTPSPAAELLSKAEGSIDVNLPQVGGDKEGQPLVMPGDAHWSYIDED